MKTLKQLEREKAKIEKQINVVKKNNHPYSKLTDKQFNELRKEYKKIEKEGFVEKIRLNIELEIEIKTSGNVCCPTLDIQDLDMDATNVKIIKSSRGLSKNETESLEDFIYNWSPWMDDVTNWTNPKASDFITNLKNKIKLLSKKTGISEQELENIIINYDNLDDAKYDKGCVNE